MANDGGPLLKPEVSRVCPSCGAINSKQKTGLKAQACLICHAPLAVTLQRKTPLKASRWFKPGYSPHDMQERAKQRLLNHPPKTTPRLDQVPDEWRNIFVEVKQAWLIINPPDYDDEYYQCALCPQAVHKDEVTLDHIKPRGTHPHLKYDFQNLQPAHAICNSRKGSLSMEAYFWRWPQMARQPAS